MRPRTIPASAGAQKRIIPVLQGEFRVSGEPGVVFSTVLGSCVSVCLFDPCAGLGGMNHYLLPEMECKGSNEIKFGAMAIELLINALLKAGADRSRLRAKLCGGANIVSNLGKIGERNASFAREYMRREGFPVVAEDLGGRHARRLQFRPTSGDAKVFAIPTQDTLRIANREHERPAPRTQDVTLF